MWILQLTTALGGSATLHVAVHRDAGTVYDIAADGAAGQCSVAGTSVVVCPAHGPVTFRWGPGGDWELSGETTVAPDTTGTAWLLPPDVSDADRRARLAEGPVTPGLVRELFLRTSDRAIPPMSAAMFDAFLALQDHEDWRVRRSFVRCLMPYARHTASDPFPSDAPSRIPAGLLTKMSRDPDKRVRKRTGHVIREIGPEDPLSPEVAVALNVMLKDGNAGVRRVATTVVTKHAQERGDTEPLEAWNAALARVEQPGAPGRAACNGLAKLHRYVDPAEIDADGALALILQHHPERAWRYWGAWHDELPFDSPRAELLLRDTVGLSEKLLRHWAETEPDGLADLVERWEPAEPHSERFRVVSGWLDQRTEHAALRTALALPPVPDDRLSGPSEGVEPE